ncbi:MAG TPA: MFS transporter [Ramlibacter sp.]|jgi:MFS family permease|uniref:MFS transporter n=1 Tax=Ramlibacter sp. TaxID=1917967 RepID=UPI002D22ECF3|nr:MFS transporter [Ramlibacter sp.]HZY19084.1 MFS transporter [Ramlibacter sp.]
MPDHEREPTALPPRVSAFGPLGIPVFRMLWFTWLAANTTMWMNDVAAAWLMTSIAPSPLWVALVQSASTLPVFFLGLPSGALADILDRRRYFMVTQFWVAGIASVLCTMVLLDAISPALLLALTFANGVGLAMRWPVFAAIIPEIVPRPQLAQALALNGVAMNASRIIGPLIAGALIAGAGSAWVFVLNALLSLTAGFVIMRWRREHRESPLGRERLTSAMRVGLQFVRQSSRMRGILLRISVFFLHSTAQLALLPLVARALPGGAAGTYTALLAAMGAGAIFAALQMPRIRTWLPLERLVLVGTALQAAGTLAVAYAPATWLAVPAMFVSGMAWITVANSLTVAAQMALPDWVRARGMSIYQMCLMGSTATGAAFWGQVATSSSVRDALTVAAFTGVFLMLVVQRLMADRGSEEDLSPSSGIQAPHMSVLPQEGRIQVHVEYLIDPTRATEFEALMQDTRRSRLRQGALGWQLLHDLSEPGRYVEQITDESWTEHLRRFDRITAADAQLRDRRLAFHVGAEPPVVSRFVIVQD